MSNRLVKLREKLTATKATGLLVTSPYNLRYLTGFTGTTGLAVITMEEAFFITDFRYKEQVAKQCIGFELIQNTGPIFEALADLVNEKNIEVLGFEADYMPFSTYKTIEKLVEAPLVGITAVVETLREVKEEAEIATIKKACEIADSAFTHILGYIKEGMTEIQVANELDFHMRSLGATGVSFETIVASGVRSAMPHGVASEKVIEKGDMITLDFGCYYNGYVSDMTRTIALGDPGEELKNIHQRVLDAQLKVTAAAKPGMSGVALDQVARGYFEELGCAEAFGHSTGHGIGLEIHEGPNVSRVAEKLFVPGNVITNEPGLYYPGVGGCRIEDDLLITETGVEVLTKSPKELIII